ncbi:MAG TPA: hypothetical protein VLW06_02990 [Terriglobales bacterium]|nr:hypothetical protein [Terriglobales bacterium]
MRNLLRLFETREEQHRRVAENRHAIEIKIQRGLDQLDRGEGIPENALDIYLANLKSSV